MSAVSALWRRRAGTSRSTGSGFVWLDDPEACDPARVGGKAAALGRLAGRWPVPPGFCVPADAHRRLAGSARGAQGTAQRTLHRDVAAAYRRLGARAGRRRPRVAVRSSAVAEDGADASFAGQHETVLGVVGARSVAAAVGRCWESADTEAARAYRDARGVAGAPAMAVLVQALVDAEVSAVAFSADPVTGARDTVVVDASWGLGEAVVAGAVTPDTYRIRRDPLALVDREVATKDVMVVRGRRGTREVAVPPRRRSEAALDESRCLEVARLAVELEEETGHPVDVECAYEAGRLVLLQCRPITSLPTS